MSKKRAWGALSGRWVPHDLRDTVVDFVRVWSDKTEIAADRFVAWIGIARGKFFAWKKHYGKANEHNGHVPRDHWLLDEEDVVAASPSNVYRVLAAARLLDRWNKKPSKKGTGSCSRCGRMSTSTSTSPTSTSPVPSTTCARSSTARAVASCTGRSARP